MYAAGPEHPLKKRSLWLLERVIEGSVDAVIDAEVLQEILHRYQALRRWREGRAVYDEARNIFARVLPVTVEVLDRARDLLDRHPELMARDALHAAVVHWYGLEAICSFDRDFDRIQGLRRLEPGQEV
jgi:hypothetical protein